MALFIEALAHILHVQIATCTVWWWYLYIYTSGQTRPKGGSLHVLSVCQLVRHRLVVPLLLMIRPQLVMHWLVVHALAKDSPGWPGEVSVTDLQCVHAIYMEDHHRQTTDCKKLMVPVCATTPLSFFSTSASR